MKYEKLSLDTLFFISEELKIKFILPKLSAETPLGLENLSYLADYDD